MIINLRGTSGAGKSTLVRKVMDCYAVRTPLTVAGRKRPLGYMCERPDGPSLYVVGHYEQPCGGCDTIVNVANFDGGMLDFIYSNVRSASAQGHDVIYEGLIVQSDIRRCVELNATTPVLVIILDVPLEVCLAGIQSRRDARGDVRQLNPKNTIAKMKTVPLQERRLKAGGVDVRRLGRDDAERVCLDTLRLGSSSVPPAAAQEVRLF